MIWPVDGPPARALDGVAFEIMPLPVRAGDGNRTRMTSLEDLVNMLRTARDVGFCWSVDPQSLRIDRDGCYMDCYRLGAWP
jgi:hypothetical protein